MTATIGCLNAYLKPLLMILDLPLTILTFGLFIVVINTALLLLMDWLAGELDLSFSVDNFGVGSFWAPSSSVS